MYTKVSRAIEFAKNQMIQANPQLASKKYREEAWRNAGFLERRVFMMQMIALAENYLYNYAEPVVATPIDED